MTEGRPRTWDLVMFAVSFLMANMDQVIEIQDDGALSIEPITEKELEDLWENIQDLDHNPLSTPGSCPKCTSNRIWTDHFECDGEYAWREIECKQCGNEYDEVFKFAHLEKDNEIYTPEK